MGIFKNEKGVTIVTPKTFEEVDHLLSIAEPAEEPGIPQPYLDAGIQEGDYPTLEKEETLDGVWACCSCPTENSLVHFQGAHPFKYLDCAGCGHFLCQDCVTSEIIVPWDEKRFISLIDQNQGELQLFQICPSCGLSHRPIKSATRDHLNRPLCWLPKAPHPHFKAEKCPCSLTGDFNWPKYMIGQPYTFRMNAEQAKHECKQKLQRNKLAMSGTTHTPKQVQSPRERIDSVWEHPGPQHGDSFDFPSPHSSLQNTPVCSPTLTTATPQVITRKRRSDLTVETNTCLLQRSNAVRIKSSYTPRSSSYQDLPVSAHPWVRQRAETWANNLHYQGFNGHGPGMTLYTPRSSAYFPPRMTDQTNDLSPASYQEIRDKAESLLKHSLGDDQYSELEGTTQGESLIQDTIREIYGQHATRRDSYAQPGLDRIEHLAQEASSLTIHAPQPLRRAITENDLLRDSGQTPLQALSHGQQDFGLNIPSEDDWKEAYLMMIEMNLVGEDQVVPQPEEDEEDDPFESLKWLEKHCDQHF